MKVDLDSSSCMSWATSGDEDSVEAKRLQHRDAGTTFGRHSLIANRPSSEGNSLKDIVVVVVWYTSRPTSFWRVGRIIY